MRLTTVQHKEVYKILINTGEYRASEEFVSEILIKPYRFMQKQLGFNNTPIFSGIVGHYVDFGGARFEDDYIAIELEIPDEFIKIQRYYDWSDFIYFTELPWEFKEVCNVDKFETVEDWAVTIMDISGNISKADEHKDALQATVEYLKKDWVIGTLEDLSKLEEECNDNGGRAILKDLSHYR